MKEYIISIMTSGAVIGIIGLMFSGKSYDGVSKYIKLLSSLVMICVFFSPIADMTKYMAQFSFDDYRTELPDFEKIADDYDSYIIEDARNRLSSELCGMIFDKTGIMPDTCRIEFIVEKREEITEVKIDSVLIAIESNIAGLSEYVSELTGCEKDKVTISVVGKE